MAWRGEERVMQWDSEGEAREDEPYHTNLSVAAVSCLDQVPVVSSCISLLYNVCKRRCRIFGWVFNNTRIAFLPYFN